MNTAGLAILVRMGNCLCIPTTISMNGRKFRVRETLGEGGFSTVDLVEDSSNHRLFALKKITCHSPRDEKYAIAEVEYHKTLSHPNILECIDSDMIGVSDIVGNTTSQVRLLLPHCQRGTLHDELMKCMKAGTHLSEVIVLTMFHSICDGVRVMHSNKPYGLAHRDLKSSNILLKSDLTPLIMDLGSMTKARVEVTDSRIARQLQDEAAERSSMPYKAPELFNVESNSVIDERTDIWSLGCLLYAMCFYKSPFDVVYERGDSVALAVVSGRIDIPETHPYSEKLIELIFSLMKVQPDERPFIDWILQSIENIQRAANGVV